MSLELNLNFPDSQHVIVSLIDGNESETTDLLEFSAPISDKGAQHLRWYLEKYATQYSADIDFETAERIAKQLPALGMSLFNNVFSKRQAQRLFKKFRDQQEIGRLLTITGTHPTILSLPWELLHHAIKGGNFLIEETPRISIRRLGTTTKTFAIKPKEKLHLLFVVCRPNHTDFMTTNVQAVLDTLNPTKRVTVEFLRPPL